MPDAVRHVGLNAHLLSGRANYRSAGIHHYLYNLLAHLPSAAPDLRLTVYLGEGQVDLGGTGGGSVQVKRSGWPTGRPEARIAWEQLRLPWAAQRDRLDLLHAPGFVAPLAAPCPLVVTVYDLSFLRYPAYFRLPNRLYLRLFTGLSCRRARRVIAISHSTKRDVIERFGLAASQVAVVYPGSEPRFRPLPQAQVQAFRAAHQLPDEFVLYLGTLEPRKNVAALVRAFARARRPGLKLVMAGGQGWKTDEMHRALRETGLEGEVILPGYVPDEDKPLWYNAARLFVYPSEYEGFGLPVLEALGCGVPVITANASSLPEVAGEAACLVPPGDVEALAEAMNALLGNAAQRDELAGRGPQQAARFSWPAAAQRTAEVYRQAVGGPVGR